MVLKKCGPCARYFRGKPPHQGLLQNIGVGEVLECLSLDFCGPFPVSHRGNRYSLSIIDHFSRWAIVVATRNQEAKTAARVLMEQWICHYGCPLQILTDQGPSFEAELFKHLCLMLGIDKTRTSPYKASSNGLNERLHRTINSMIGKAVQNNNHDWDLHLAKILCAYRLTIHSTTGFSPCRLFLNREIILPNRFSAREEMH